MPGARAGASRCWSPTWMPSGRGRWRPRSGARRFAPTPRWPSAPTCSCSATSPPQLEAVAAGIDGRATAIASILGGTTLEDLHAAYPGIPVFRFIPSVAVEVRTGALGYAEQELDEAAAALEPQVLELFGRLGRVVPLPESLIDVAMGLMSTSPAYVRGDRRGAHRRRHPPRHAARHRGRARGRRDGRHRRAARGPRPRHACPAPLGDVAGRGHRAGAGRARAGGRARRVHDALDAVLEARLR